LENESRGLGIWSKNFMPMILSESHKESINVRVAKKRKEKAMITGKKEKRRFRWQQ